MKLRLLSLITLLTSIFVSHLSWGQPAQKLSLSAIPQTAEETSAEHALPELINLQQDAQIAGDRFALILVSQPNCQYCELITREILQPMQLSGKYDKKLLFRKLTIFDDSKTLVDFNGNRVDATAFARRYNSAFTPTLLFVDPNDGKVLTDKMVGINTVDLYGFYVDRAVNKARKALRYKLLASN